MAVKFLTFALLVATAHAGVSVVQPATVIQPVAQSILAKELEEYDPNPQYIFSYDIQDSLTGDVKNQQETRSGDVVKGQYSLIDADGYKRTVDYAADPLNGFSAIVSRKPLKAAFVSLPLVKSYAAQPAIVAQPQPIYKAESIAYPQPALVAQPQPIYKAATISYSQPALIGQPQLALAQPLLKTVSYPQQSILKTPLLKAYA